ncbi:MAG: FGGY family carbohydrate kinase, partial [Candidatus Margulisiibacteriota bacterium]
MVGAKGVLGIDFGTGGTRAFAIDESGRVIASAQRPSSVIRTERGYLEQNMAQSAGAGVEAIKTLLEQPAVRETQIVALGTSGWMHGDVLMGNNVAAA